MTNNATRQAAYRERHLLDVQGQGVRINTVVSIKAKLALERMAKCYGVTQKQMLERALDVCERATLVKAAKQHGAQHAYYDGHLRLDPDPVTQ
jgi:hypothetical protein